MLIGWTLSKARPCNFHWIPFLVLQNSHIKIHLSCVTFRHVSFMNILYKRHSCVWQPAFPTHFSAGANVFFFSPESLCHTMEITKISPATLNSRHQNVKCCLRIWPFSKKPVDDEGAEKVTFKWRGDLERPSCVCQTGWWWLEMPPRPDAVPKPCASSWLCTKSNLGKTQVRQPRDGGISKRRGGETEIERERGAQHGCPKQPAAVTEREDIQTYICRLCLSGGSCWLAGDMCRFQCTKSWWY